MKKYATTGDGILTAIMVAEEVCDKKSSLSSLTKNVTLFPQITKSFYVRSKDEVMGDSDIKDAVGRIESELTRGGRILLRKSGTEPVIRIMAEAIKNDLFVEAFTTRQYVIEPTNMSERRSLQTGNFMVDSTSKLYYDERVLGGRTGVTEDGRRCLATLADNNGMRLVCVVMGTESEYQEDGYSAISIGGYKETTTLLDAGSNGYQTAQVIFANQALRQREVLDGDSNVVMGPKNSVITILPGNVSLENLTFQYSDLPLQAPISVGDKVSNVRVFNGNICVAQADLYALNSVKDAQNLQVVDGSGGDSAVLQTVLIVVLSVAVTAVAVLFILRGIGKVRLLAAKKRKNRYHRSHRRSR